ncbi:MAG: aspartate aminotransferase family protein [Deltaproteobacteria bacterium]|nr:aspartate aminotransferase family protein [Deltaproteobacteria bacterium]
MGYFGNEHQVSFASRVFPKRGRTEAEVMAHLDEFGGKDVDDNHGHAIVYAMTLMNHLDAARISKVANMNFVKKNMLFKELMVGTERMSLEVKRMVIEILNYPDDARVRFTSGGSESLYCAINTARQWAKVERPRIAEPEIVVPYSIHAAMSKWCRYTGIKIKRVPLGPDFRADVKAIEKAVTANTIFIAGSAPCWPYGLYDNIEALSALAESRGIWMHVDACLGGFLAAFVERAGHKLPVWDFRNPGVRSISADLHKYGFACKPLSSITYRNKEFEKYHAFAPSDWPDGPYNTESMLGSTPAGPIASAWAVMQFLGEEGYVDLAKRCLQVKKRYIEGINAIEGMKCWESDLSPLVFEVPRGMDTFAVMGGLFDRQFYCLPCLQPPLIKIIVDPVTDEVVDGFVGALREVVDLVKKGSITIENLKPYM